MPYVLSIMRERDADLVLLHVVEEKNARFSFEHTMGRAEPLERLHQLVSDDVRIQRKPRYIVDIGAPDAVILEAAEACSAAFIVVGARRGAFPVVETHFGGGTAYKVAVRAKCPELTIPRN